MADAPQAKKTPEALWAELEALPEGLKGEIIDGELHVMPRPRRRHGRASLAIGSFVGSAFDDYDDDGPGGWTILIEPGIELPDAREVSPDVAGWRNERFASSDPDEPIRVVPDWVCEVLSPSNARYDRRVKFPFYARVGVSYLWVVDSRDRTVDVCKLIDGRWSTLRTFADDEPMRAEPFEAIEIPLARLWVTTPSSSGG